MKVILIKDVARLGRKSEIKEVPNGHATNFLIPRGLAIIANQESTKRHDEEVKKHGEQEESATNAFKTMLATFNKGPITYIAETNEKGVLFKGLRSEDIARHLQTLNFTITKEQIILDRPIKEVGTYEVPLERNTVKGVCHLEIIKK